MWRIGGGICLFASLFFGLGVSRSGAAASGPAQGVILFDFENPAQIAKIVTSPGVKVTQAPESEFMSTGHASLKMFFPKYEAGKDKWQFVHLPIAAADSPIADWTQYGTLAFEAHNPSLKPQEGWVRLSFASEKTRRPMIWTDEYVLNLHPHEARTFRIDIDDLNRKWNVSGMKELRFVAATPPNDIVLYIDSIRLEPRDVADLLGFEMLSPHYRHALYGDQKASAICVRCVRRWAYEENRPLPLETRLYGPDGGLAAERSVSLGAEPVELSFSCPEIPAGGAARLEMTLGDGSGKELSRKSCEIPRYPSAPHMVTIREDNVLLVNGKPMLPIGVNDGRKGLSQYGINCVRANGECAWGDMPLQGLSNSRRSRKPVKTGGTAEAFS